MSRIAVLAICTYQKTFSPILYLLGVRCRFYPSCSAYAVLAFSENGFRRGLSLTYRRLLRAASISRPLHSYQLLTTITSCAARSPSRNHQSPFFSSISIRTKYEHTHPASPLL